MGASQSIWPQTYRRRPDLPQQQQQQQRPSSVEHGLQVGEQRHKGVQSARAATPSSPDVESFPSPGVSSDMPATASSSFSETSTAVATMSDDSPNHSRHWQVTPRQLSTVKVTNSGLTRSRRFTQNLSEVAAGNSRGNVSNSRPLDSSLPATRGNWVEESPLPVVETSKRSSLTMKVASPSPLFLVRDKQDEEERSSIAQAEAVYERATWRMYHRIAHARSERDRRQQRFRVPPPAPRTQYSMGQDQHSSKTSETATTDGEELILGNELPGETAAAEVEQPTVFSLELT